MCMIIYRPSNAAEKVSRDRLAYCATVNPHGLGLMWAFGGRLMLARYSMASKKQFFDRFMALQKQNIPVCAHFRYMTHGREGKDNCHPFWIHEGKQALMHNGVLNIRCSGHWSDTKTFVLQVLRPLPSDWIDQPHLSYLVNEASHGNRFAIMDHTGRVTLFHESSGIWDGGIWYANSGYKPYAIVISNKGNGSSSAYDSGKQWDGGGGKYMRRWSKGENLKGRDLRKKYPAKSWSQWDSQTGRLSLFEGMVLCDDCLRMETSATDAMPIPDVDGSDYCELCGIRGRDSDPDAPPVDITGEVIPDSST